MLHVDKDKERNEWMNEWMNEWDLVIKNFLSGIINNVEEICANCWHFIPGFNEDPNKDWYCGYNNEDVNKNDTCSSFYPD